MNAKAAIFSFSLVLVIFLLVAETTLAKPKALPTAFHVERYARNKMFLPEHDNPEAIREIVERDIPATEIEDKVCFGPRPFSYGTFKINQDGALKILRMDFRPPFPAGETRDLELADENGDPVTPQSTTSDNIHFDFRFDTHPYKVSVGQKFRVSRRSGYGGPEICLNVYGYYSD